MAVPSRRRVSSWVVICLGLLVPALAACGPGVSYPRDRPVFQMSTGGGFTASLLAWVPKVTLWGNGRAVFVDGGVLREGRLGKDTLANIMSEAIRLYDLPDSFTASPPTTSPDFTHSNKAAYGVYAVSQVNPPYTIMSLETDLGRKTVSLSGINLDLWWLDELGRSDLETLRTIYRLVRSSLPEDATPVQPEEISVITSQADGSTQPTRHWPRDLVGRLSDEKARAAIELAGAIGRTAAFMLEVPQWSGPGEVTWVERPHWITVIPTVPVLYRASEPDRIFGPFYGGISGSLSKRPWPRRGLVITRRGRGTHPLEPACLNVEKGLRASLGIPHVALLTDPVPRDGMLEAGVPVRVFGIYGYEAGNWFCVDEGGRLLEPAPPPTASPEPPLPPGFRPPPPPTPPVPLPQPSLTPRPPG